MAGNISTETTTLSNLTIDRNLSCGTLLGSPAITGGATTTTTLTATTSLAVGGGTALTRTSKGTFAVAAITVANASSATTAATISPLATTDVIIVNPGSVLSANVQMGEAYVSAASTVILSFINASATTAVVAAQTMRYVAFRS